MSKGEGKGKGRAARGRGGAAYLADLLVLLVHHAQRPPSVLGRVLPPRLLLGEAQPRLSRVTARARVRARVRVGVRVRAKG